MKKRKKAILVVDDTAADWQRAWNRTGEQLHRLDLERFARVLRLARTYVSVYSDPDEDERVFRAGLAVLQPSGVTN